MKPSNTLIYNAWIFKDYNFLRYNEVHNEITNLYKACSTVIKIDSQMGVKICLHMLFSVELHGIRSPRWCAHTSQPESRETSMQPPLGWGSPPKRLYQHPTWCLLSISQEKGGELSRFTVGLWLKQRDSGPEWAGGCWVAQEAYQRTPKLCGCLTSMCQRASVPTNIFGWCIFHALGYLITPLHHAAFYEMKLTLQ